MASVSYVKGVRTRYRNTLEKELKTVRDTFGTDVSTLSLPDTLNDIHKSKCLLKTYSEKLMIQMEKLTECLSKDDPDYVETMLDEDCELNLSVETCLIELEQFSEKLCSKSAKVEEPSKPSDTQRLVEQIQKLMSSQMDQHTDILKTITTKDKTESPSVKLPKLELNMFYGNKLQWCEFWDVFECTVHKNKKLSNIEKFTYLLSKLGGEAKRAVSGLARTNENYNVAMKLLSDRYGNKQEIVDLHYKELMTTSSPSNKVASLRAFQDSIEKHLRSLEVLGENVEQHVFVSMIRAKLPEDVLRQLEFNKGTKVEWSLENIRTQLEDYIVSCERAMKRNIDQVPNNKTSFPNTTTPKRHYSSYNAGYNNRFQADSANRPSSSAETLFAGAKLRSKQEVIGSKHSVGVCRYCEKKHWSDECTEYRTLDERKRKIKGCCYRCLKQGHMASDCKSNKACVFCSDYNKHHRSLCPRKFKTKQRVEATAVSLVEEEVFEETSSLPGENAMVSVGESVFMQTATTEVKHSRTNASITTRILLDCGSQRTYITQSLANNLGLKPEKVEELKVVTFGSSQSKIVKTYLTTVCLKLRNGEYMEIKANIVPVISGHIQRKTLDISSMSELDYLVRSVDLADSLPTKTEATKVDLLLGNDYYLDIVLSQKMEVFPGLYLLSSKLGWILAGRAMSEDHELGVPNLLILTYGVNVTKTSVFQSVESESVVKTGIDLQNFWDMESIGIKDSGVKSDDDTAMETFKESMKFEDGRYLVTFPWKERDPDLPRNRELAYGRLKSCLKKLRSKPELLQKYNAVIQDQLGKGIIEKVNHEASDGLQHYIPHHAVVNPQKTTTKVRVVYDASAKLTKDHRSLNECLYRGPVLLHDLCGLLMRFRLHKIALVSDIEKAFLQVGLQPSERDVTRFLWVKDITHPWTTSDNIQVLRFCRVPFGVISSPFLLAATIEAHLDTYDTYIAKKLKGDIYVDNLITGAKTVKKAMEMYQTSKSIFTAASMNLREWLSNNAKVNEFIPRDDRAEPKVMQVLGHTWDSKADTLALKQKTTTELELSFTKQSILRRLASVFDPMGLFSPVVITGKTLLQEIWTKKFDWDDPIEDQTIKDVWNDLVLELQDISKYNVPRYIGYDKEEKVFNIVCFCDASKKAYAATVYLHQGSSSGSKTNLVFAKTRLAPVKEITIPRLELMAIVIGVRCIQYVKEQLHIEIANTYLWSDSQVALAWINSDKRLPVFVKNRVSEIKEHSDIVLGYVNTKENPADVATKGATAKSLYMDSLWWYGPSWLSKPSCEWEIDLPHKSCSIVETDGEHEGISPVVSATEKDKSDEKQTYHTPLGIDCERFSSVTKLLRVTALALRFIRKLRRQKVSSCVTSIEIKEAENLWIISIQKKVFETELNHMKQGKLSNLQKQLGIYVDSEGIIRCKGRLDNSCLEEGARKPILLPKGEKFTCLVIEKAHRENLHSGVSQTLAGVRSKYWIPHGRSLVKSVLHRCTVCRRHEGGPYRTPPMAPLPASRVRESCPFSKTGVDYFGPLLVRSSKEPQKVWICLFSCMVTRAVHLELIQDMTTAEFLLAFKRFIAQRGTPYEVISDNAAHFKLASKTVDILWKNVINSDDVQSYVSSSRINWHFIVELAPWMGGFYERLVGIVKRSLRKSIGRKLLTLIQLQTLIKEVEAVVNSRPLVYLNDDINSTIALTPSHFLTPNPRLGTPETDNDSDPEYSPVESSCDRLLVMWKKGQKLLNEFWRIWREQYLVSLRERTQTSLKAGRVVSREVPKYGDIVLVKDNLPRGSWKTGKVIELVESRDKVIRSARVQLPTKKILNRPLSLLYPLECSSNGSERCSKDSQRSEQTEARRPYREAREVAKRRIKEHSLI